MPQQRKERIRMFIADSISHKNKEVVSGAVRRFEVSRQTIHKYLKEMVDEGILEATGRTQGRTYGLKPLASRTWRFLISDQPAEDRVWREAIAPQLSGLPDNIRGICNYGFTEIFNNAIEHSNGTTITAGLERNYVKTTLFVKDNGIGIFKKIKDSLGLAEEREAILELTKGKMTTDPEAHTGEGIFFTTRMFDWFALLANGLLFEHMVKGDDWLIETRSEAKKGTFVTMSIDSTTTRTATEVFNQYTSNGDVPTFDKTHVPVALLRVGEENLLSRSQAKRLLARFARFKEVMLDFAGVDHIGRAFADEIFRVYKNQNPNVKILPIGANKDVLAMIDSVHSGGITGEDKARRT